MSSIGRIVHFFTTAPNKVLIKDRTSGAETEVETTTGPHAALVTGTNKNGTVELLVFGTEKSWRESAVPFQHEVKHGTTRYWAWTPRAM